MKAETVEIYGLFEAYRAMQPPGAAAANQAAFDTDAQILGRYAAASLLRNGA